MNKDAFRELVDKDYADNFMTGRIYELTEEEINKLSQTNKVNMEKPINFIELIYAKGYKMRNGKIINSNLVELTDEEVETLTQAINVELGNENNRH